MRSICTAAVLLFCTQVASADFAARTIDLALLGDDAVMRVYGNLENGGMRGVPVAGGFDMDGDGHGDVAMSSMLASPFGRTGAGEVYLVFGDGTIAGSFDTAVPDARILRVAGDVTNEATGCEIWMDDVTGDGLGDLLVARQNFTPDAGRIGAGALSIIVGDAALRTLAEAGTPIDLRAPPVGLTIATAIGVAQTARLGIWIRTGDVTGDGVADLLVGSDQESSAGEAHHGAVYLLRGGEHLAATQTIDLAELGSESFALAAHVARVRPPSTSSEYHLGATVHVADLDGNGRAEVLAAATIARTGAAIPAFGAPQGSAHDRRGAHDGTIYIAWDENFAGEDWSAVDFALDDPGVVATSINGGVLNQNFGEEIAGGNDVDGDGAADLFGGDLVASADGRPPASGLGHLISGMDDLRNVHFDLDAPPSSVAITTFIGSLTGEISSDTAIDGDFDGDGRADLAFSSPHASPLGRAQAGVLHVFHGQDGAWPALVDLANGALPPAASLYVTQVLGAHGAAQQDFGDTLAYSAAAGDLDDDGKTDMIINAMNGNGPSADDAGMLIVVSGALVAPEPGGAALAAGASIATAAVARARRRRLGRRSPSRPPANR